MITALVVFVAWLIAVGGFVAFAGPWLKPRDLTDDEIAEFIRIKRDERMREFPILYPTEEKWNERNLVHEMKYAANHPSWAREDILSHSRVESLLDRAARVDPVELRRRIRDMEREAGL